MSGSVSLAKDVPTVLSTRALGKTYGAVRVVHGVDLDVDRGSIHALLGENGAGKSTVIRMLSGDTAPSEGAVLIDGEPVRLRSVRDAQEHGIVALPQELSLVPTLGAAENIGLGIRRPGARVFVDRRALTTQAVTLLERLGQRFPVDVPVAELSAVQQTMVALARALARNARVLVLDEPTAALTDTETERLFTVLRSLRDEGTSIVYVSHRLEEVFALADTLTVMRSGERVWTKAVAETDADDVVAAMIGRPHGQSFPARTRPPGPPVLEVEALRGHTVDDVSLTISAGSVLGVAGLAGSGRSELLKLVAGVERPVAGHVRLAGTELTRRSIAARMSAGIVLVPEERRSQGLVMHETIAGNIALANLRGTSRFGVASRAREREVAERHLNALRVRATGTTQPVGELSGGNQQKVLLAKYLERRPRVLLLDEPTRGIDVGTKAEIYALIRRLADDGVAVVVVSSEIPELLGLADDIAVLHEGRVTGTVAAADATAHDVLRLCYRTPA